MSHLGSHLEQIHYSCQGIDSLPFPPPKIFTNALLSNHDITSLIRDTETHERALFSVPPPNPPPPPSTTKRGGTAPEIDAKQPAAKRRQTVFNVTATGDVVTTGPPSRSTTQPQPRKHTAVAAVLGVSMHERLRRNDVVDVEVLLRGAETLCGVYELPGARERIASLRAKWRNGRETVGYYEGRVAEQAVALAGLSRNWMEEQEGEEGVEEEGEVWTVEDLKREEEEARELETKKRELQARLQAMEKDLGGLRSM